MIDHLEGCYVSQTFVDLAFSVTKPEWAKAASALIDPGWSLRLAEHDTGAEVIGFNPSEGIGVTIQPFFVNETSMPELLVIRNLLPPGTQAPMTDSVKKEMESLAQQEIGATYSVTLKHKINAQLPTVIEFWLRKA